MSQSCRCGRVSWPCLNLLLLSTLATQGHLHVNRPLDWWGTPGRWGNLSRHGQNIKRVYMQSYNPGVLGWGFLRLLLCLQLRSLSRGVPSSRRRQKINSQTHLYLFIKASCIVLHSIRLCKEPLTWYVILNSLRNEIP